MYECPASMVYLLLALAACTAALLLPTGCAGSSDLHERFASPPRQYSSGPLWVWNDMMTDDLVVSTMRDLAAQHVRQAFVHPRPGLMTPYLSDEWFRLWRVALDEAERLDMNLWIYDENSYPSGFAGGFVPEALPDSRSLGIACDATDKSPKWTDDTVGVYLLVGEEYKNVTAQARSGGRLPDGSYLVFSLQRAPEHAWFGGKWYVDLLRPGVTEKFLEVTLEPYRQRLGEQFGRRIPGSFTDEPVIHLTGMTRGIPWTPDLPERFQKRWGYALTDHLPALERPLGDYRKIRHDYYQLLLEEFIKHWAQPYYDYCEKNGLEFTGHYWEHSWPFCTQVPDNMAMYAWHQRPAIDTLMNQYSESVDAQFGNVRAVKELGSVANQLGLQRTLCEAYGAGGWDLRFEDMKRIADWLYVLGVNTLDEHLSYVTLRGARKRDHPQSFSYHEPWWEAYHVCADYVTRLSVAMSAGRQVNDVLIIEPTSTAWQYNTAAGMADPKLKEIGDLFQKLVTDMEKAQREFDLGCEDIIARHGAVAGDRFTVGQRSYRVVVLPPKTETLNGKTVELLEAFLNAGGQVVCCGEPPDRVDGGTSDRVRTLAGKPGWTKAEPAQVATMTLTASKDGFAVWPDGEGLVFHHRRQVEGGELLLLVNTSLENTASGAVESPAREVEQWDLHTGATLPMPFEKVGKDIRIPFELPRAGSMLLSLRQTSAFALGGSRAAKADAEPPAATPIEPEGPPAVRRIGPNVLTLDYADVTSGGETRKAMSVYKASGFVFSKNGLPAGNPWERAVQFRDELLRKEFPSDSGLEATYRFTIAQRVPDSLFAVIERGDLYSLTCNDKPLLATKGDWWLDRAFTKIDIAGVARVGENTIRLAASPLTMLHEVEAVFILGEFELKPLSKGFEIIPSEQPLQLGPWNEQGMPFYAAGVSYKYRFNVDAQTGRYRLAMPVWYGSVARVVVNGKPAGHIWHQPWECDVTEHLAAGVNDVEVIVIGTLKNTLGPHHGKPPLGKAWPAMWDNAPESGPPAGREYATVGYGLFEPPVLRHLAGP